MYSKKKKEQLEEEQRNAEAQVEYWKSVESEQNVKLSQSNIEQVKKAHTRTELLHKEATWGKNLLAMLGSILLFPFWINSLWPNLFMWLIGKSFTFRKEDPMWEGTFMFAINALFIIPIFTLPPLF